MSTSLRPPQKALIKSSSQGGWKVGYQHHCRSSAGPARLHPLNTSLPSPSQTWPRLPRTTPMDEWAHLLFLLFHCEYLLYFSHFFHQSTPPLQGYLHSFAYIIDEEQEQRCAVLWTCHVNTFGLMGLYCKAELGLLFPFRWAESLCDCV